MRSAKPLLGCVATTTVFVAAAGFLSLSAGAAAVFAASAAPSTPSSPADPDEAHPGASIEPLYADALIHLHRGDRAGAQKILSDLLARAPEHVEGLMLRAQIYQIEGNDPEVVAAYLKLIQIKTDENRLAYFRFELAYAYHRLKRFDLARPMFQQAIAQGFNVAGGNLVLGIEDLQAGKTIEAESEFEKAKATPEISTRIPAMYYLAMTEYQLGFEAAGTRQAYEALHAAQTAPADTAPKGMMDSSNRLLQKIAGPRLFGSVSMLGQYDSNVGILPGQNLASGISAAKLALDAGVGEMSAATSNFQWVGSLNFNGALNFPNSTTAEYEYETLTPSLYLNHAPLSTLPWGFKLATNLTEQGQPGGFRFFLLGADAGAYIKYHPGTRSELGLDAGIRPQDYVTSDASGFSGSAYYLRLSASKETLSAAFNPSANLQLETASVTNTAFSYTLIGFEVGNTFRLGTRDRVAALCDLGFYTYGAASGGRSDVNLTPHLDWIHPLSPAFSVIVDALYTSNTSTLASTYGYSRLVVGAGANYSF